MSDERTVVLAGRYEVERPIGRGGMATVYLGTDRVLGRPVAVKVLGRTLAENEEFVERFRREAQAAAALTHPNVVAVYDSGSDGNVHFIVMEYVQGKTLAQTLREEQLTPERAVEVADEVAAALGFAHRAGIVHRDVKPGNIMITPSGDVKVMDFGIARATASASLTQTATVLGTATYFSPEQAEGGSVDARSDLYSLGVLLYEMLAGRPPFEGDTAVAVAYKHVREDPVLPSRRNPDVPPALDAIVLRLLAKDPEARYQSADELRGDLARLRSGELVEAAPFPAGATTQVITRGEGGRTQVMPATPAAGRRSPWVVVAVVVALVVLIGLAFYVLARTLAGPNVQTVAVPDVRGQTQAQATAHLKDAGFRVGPVRTSSSDVQPAGHVISYSPSGSQPKGTVITLVVSTGPAKSTVPSVICLPLAQAESRLTNAGFFPQFRGQAASPTCTTPGAVSRQRPTAGTQYPKNGTVDLWIVPQPTTPPPTTPPPTTPPPTSPPTTPPPTSPPPTSPGSPLP